MLKGLPDCCGAWDMIYACGLDDSTVYSYKGKGECDYNRTCDYYEKRGYRVYSRTAMGENHATTFTRGAEMAHVYWLKHENELNIVLSATAAATLPPESYPQAETVCACTVAQIGNFGGMAYVIQLTDGSFIIYDGGYATDLQNLHEYLQAHRIGDRKPLVRAWLITHSHNDHYPVFTEYCRDATYRDSIDLQHILVSPLNAETFDLDPQNEKGYLAHHLLRDAAAFRDVRVVVAHTGMEFTFSGMKMEILLTPENLFKGLTKLINTNDSSIVSRLYQDGYSALFLGDIMGLGTNYMVKQYGSYLQSDMCQISHHGCDDVPASFYDVVRAPIAFYPCDEGAYDNFPYNRHVRLAVREAPYTKEILIANLGLFVRPWGTAFAEDAPLSMPGYTPPRPLPPREIPTDPRLKYQLTAISDWPGGRLGYVGIESDPDGTESHWFVLQWGSGLHIGDYDLAEVSSIQVDVIRKSSAREYPAHVLRFCKDVYGIEVLAEYRLAPTDGDDTDHFSATWALETDYSGPLCIRLGGECQAEYAFANFRFYRK